MAGIMSRLKHAWNAFVNEEKFRPENSVDGFGPSYSFRPDRLRIRHYNEQSIITAILTRISIDVAANDIRHVRLDDNDRYLEDVDSGLNQCLTVEANIDQGAQSFRQDIAFTMLEKGVAAIVPVDTTVNPRLSGSFDIKTMRVGEIQEWFPRHIRASVYNDDPEYGRRMDIVLEKRTVAIAENPLYAIMNAPNSTLQRLIRKLCLLDAIDEQSGSGKLDLIIQLPYVVKSEARRGQAEKRAKDIEFQLKGSQYGIAYTDGTEKITQLNRPVENKLLKQIEYLTTMLYGQLGLTEEIMNGTADEATMLNYRNRTIKPILTAIQEAMKRSFLTKTARSQHQSIEFFANPFELVPINNIAEIADKFTRNEIMSANEIRSIIGIKPAKDPKADELRNSNMPAPAEESAASSGAPTGDDSADNSDEVNEIFNQLDASVDSILNGA